jgi:acyl-CoA thioesterase FadM
MRKQGFFPVLTAETIRFQKSLQLFSRFTLQTQALGWDEKNFYVEQIFLRGDVVYARALISARMLNKSGKKYTAAEFITAMGLAIQSPVFPEYLKKWIASIPETNLVVSA